MKSITDLLQNTFFSTKRIVLLLLFFMLVLLNSSQDSYGRTHDELSQELQDISQSFIATNHCVNKFANMNLKTPPQFGRGIAQRYKSLGQAEIVAILGMSVADEKEIREKITPDICIRVIPKTTVICG